MSPVRAETSSGRFRQITLAKLFTARCKTRRVMQVGFRVLRSKVSQVNLSPPVRVRAMATFLTLYRSQQTTLSPTKRMTFLSIMRSIPESPATVKTTPMRSCLILRLRRLRRLLHPRIWAVGRLWYTHLLHRQAIPPSTSRPCCRRPTKTATTLATLN